MDTPLGSVLYITLGCAKNEVDTDRVVAVEFESQAELGADAIGARYEHRLMIALGHLEQRTETAQSAEHAFAHGLFGKRLDAFDECIAGIDIDAGIAIRE